MPDRGSAALFTPIRRGDRVAMIAPASPVEKELLEKASDLLRSEGLEPVRGKFVEARTGYLAGGDADRAADLIWAFGDDSIRAVLCARGGYGSSRLLPWLSFSRLRNQPKLFLGHSDTTFLHASFQSRLGWITFHGPNLADAGDAPDNVQAAVAALRGESRFEWDLGEEMILREGAARGILRGGNLTCFTHLVGTPYLPDLNGAILLIEDVGEPQYRLDRMFTHLRLAGHVNGLAGLVLGRFKDCGDVQRIHEMFVDQVRDLNIPVIAGLPCGHGAPNNVIPLGAIHAIDTSEGRFRSLGNPFLQ